MFNRRVGASDAQIKGIHKGCPHLGEVWGLATMQTKRTVGERGLASSGHHFQFCLCKQEEGN